MRIKEARDMNNLSRKQLNRAKRLYARLTWKAVRDCPTNKMLWWVAGRAQEAGLYSYGTDARWSLMRLYWKITPGYENWRNGWHRWLREYGFSRKHLLRVKFVRRVA